MQTLFSDLSRCTPAAALADGWKKDCWRLIDYQTPTFTGRMIFAGEDACPPRLCLKLGLTGFHAVYLGLYASWYTQFQPRVKLTRDPCYREFQRDTQDGFQIEEAFWQYADLTDQDLFIEKRQHDPFAAASLAYIRCVAMTDDEVAAMHAERARTDTRKLVIYNDGVCLFAHTSPRTREEMWEHLEAFRHSDAETLCWGISTDHCFHPTKIGAVFGRGVDHYDSRAWRIAAEAFHALLDQGINPIQVAGEYAHELGLQFHIYYRMENFTCTPPGDMQEHERLIGKHPEWRCLHRDGRPMVHMSYAYSGVRDYVISMLEEVAPWGADGITLNFMRGAPFVMYEPPLIEAFQKEYGQDPRQIDEFDERWLQFRCGPLTELLRQLRQSLDRIGDAEGKRIEITAISLANEALNLYYGLDVRRWLDEGLVDVLAPMGDVHGFPEVDLAYYRQLLQGRTCRFYPFLPVDCRFNTTGQIIGGAHRYYAGGADGLSLWDCAHRESVRGPVLRRLGHVDELDPAGSEPPSTLHPIEILGHVDLRDGYIPVDYKRVGKDWSHHYIHHAH